MSSMKEIMPLMAGGEGVWDGVCIRKSLLYCMFPDEEPTLHRRRNLYTWDSGRQHHRARVWQGFVDDRLVQRTLITETRVSRDWRST